MTAELEKINEKIAMLEKEIDWLKEKRKQDKADRKTITDKLDKLSEEIQGLHVSLAEFQAKHDVENILNKYTENNQTFYQEMITQNSKYTRKLTLSVVGAFIIVLFGILAVVAPQIPDIIKAVGTAAG